MGPKILLAGLVIVSVCGVSALAVSASTPRPTITSFDPTTATAGTEVTIKGTNLTGATKVTFHRIRATVISDTATKIEADAPPGAKTGSIMVKTAGGTATSSHEFSVLVPLDGAVGAASDSHGYCALLTSGAVDCWGNGFYGQLGNGSYYRTGKQGSATPVSVEGVGKIGTLMGVTSLIGDGTVGSYCALLTSGGVDCWGYGGADELGNGKSYDGPRYGSATPVAVKDVGGTGTLTALTSLIGGGYFASYCAVLTSGGVDCWGQGFQGVLGNGTFSNAATPVEVG